MPSEPGAREPAVQRTSSAGPRSPEAGVDIVATYRLQLTPDFGFDDAAAIVPHLRRLHVSHLYLSPIFEAAAGSTHGYDVVDHSRLRQAFGGEAAFCRLVEVLHAHGMRLIVDIVPNHMCIADARNRWWWDVLENGPSARAAHLFDVDWDPPEQKLKDVVLVPILGDHRGRVIARREITVRREEDRFVVAYFDHRYPVAPRSMGGLLHAALERVPSERLGFLADAFMALPLPTALDLQSIERRHRDKAVLQSLLNELFAKEPALAAAVDQALEALNADDEALDAFLDRQNYRLAWWRSAERDLDYRRFFDVNSLVGLRMEDHHVFAATHAVLGRFVKDGMIDGLRVDHVDGLTAPRQYLERLRALAPRATILVEKILAPGELLRDWPVDGTTGYEFSNDLTAVFVDPRAEGPLTALQQELLPNARPFDVVAREAREQVLREVLGSDVNRLTNSLVALCEKHRDVRDFTRHELQQMVRAVVSAFPVYRSYVDAVAGVVDDADKAVIAEAIARARADRPDLDAHLFTFFEEVLTLVRRGAEATEVVRRFQQLAAPAFAKGVEDTAFYRDVRLLALNEVGGAPERFSLDVELFHRENLRAQARFPRRMLATSTHDSKRSEDVRARLVALSEEHEAFGSLARSFFARCEAKKTSGAPEPLMVMMTLQTLVGAWPLDEKRLGGFLEKAAREAKLYTSWIRPEPGYEAALKAFATAVIKDDDLLAEVAAFVARIEPRARALSLGWTLLKMTCPGAPDFYQGTELWSFALVDPDNRRPVDWHRAQAALGDAVHQPPALEDDVVGLTKAWLIERVLGFRQRTPTLFDAASHYTALSGNQDDVLAFARSADDGGALVVAVPRRARLPAGARLTLPAGAFRSVLDDDHDNKATRGGALSGAVELAALFSRRPLALLHSPPGGRA